MDFFDLHCDTITTAMHKSVGLDCSYLDISFPKNEKIRVFQHIFAFMEHNISHILKKIKKIQKRLDNRTKIVYNFEGYFAKGKATRTNLV